MEAAKHFLKIPKNHEVKIKIPQSMPENEIVEVILILQKKRENYEQKISAIKEAAKDPLYLDDIREVSDDFKDIDAENWE